jgi:Fur family zinc uptake transcriptional regulator
MRSMVEGFPGRRAPPPRFARSPSPAKAGEELARRLVPTGQKPYLAPMAHPHHHEAHEGASLMQAAQSSMERSGEQWTQMRSAVFEALAGFDRPASAYDIADKVSKSQGRRVAANSVYRILDLFVGANLARRVESANAYIANDHPDCLHDCIFLICDTCGNTTHLDDDKLSGGVRAAAKEAGFTPERPVIEVRGTCPDCKDAG